jgi:hemerythrin superfamily protein
MTEGKNVIDLLLRDHEKAKNLLNELDSKSDKGLPDYFCNVREELVRHEVAEELIVYPAFRKNVEGGDEIADACIAEQSKAEETLAALENEDMQSGSFRTQLAELRQAVLAHAKHEESAVFPALHTHTDAEQLDELGDRYEKALEAAPTHPHPHAPDTPPGNNVLGPMAALVDRVRDAMRAV